MVDKSDAHGAFAMVLHSHIPFCRKSGVWPFGEEWLFEGLMETYIPLLNVLYDLSENGISPKFTISVTPVLAEQLNDEYMLRRFEEFMDQEILRCESDIERYNTSGGEEYVRLARFYHHLYTEVKNSYFERYNRNVCAALAKLQAQGHIEIITSAATHPYLPLMKRDSSIYAQIKTGVDVYRRYFGVTPRGIWLPECAYRAGYFYNITVNESYYKPGIDEFLVKEGIKYFVCDSHAIEGGPVFWGGKRKGLYEEIYTPEKELSNAGVGTTFLPYHLKSGCMVVARNRDTGLQVWSGDWGYPADSNYREFHKRESQSGLQYWRITGHNLDLGQKEIYIPENTVPRINENAYHFNLLVEHKLAEFKAQRSQLGLVLAPYDTELFGHWWLEGIDWLKSTAEKMYLNPYIVQMTVSEYLTKHPPEQVIDLPESSWGEGGKHYVWLNSQTEWMWTQIRELESAMEQFVAKYYPPVDDTIKNILTQMGRELLLLQSSDWPFLVTTRQAKDYAAERFLTHCKRFNRLREALEKQEYQTPEFIEFFNKITEIDTLFTDLNIQYFRRREPVVL